MAARRRFAALKMPIYEKQRDAFEKSMASAANKMSNRYTAAAPTKPAPVPVSSQTSKASSNHDLKRKRPDYPDVPYSQPKDTGTGQNIMTQVTYAIDYLKGKTTPQTLFDILSYLSIQTREEQYKRTIEKILIRHDKVNYELPRDGKEALFSFRPAHNIRSTQSLLGYLQSQPTAQGLSVKELRDGWLDAEDAIDQLEAEGKLLVTRNKKDNHARMVWPNDPSLTFEVDQEYQSIWHRIKLPEPSAVADELEKEGLTPANKHRNDQKPIKVQEKPRRKPRTGGKRTNVHMIGVLKDYSQVKKK